MKRGSSFAIHVGVRKSIEYVTNHRSSNGELLERCTVKQNTTAG